MPQMIGKFLGDRLHLARVFQGMSLQELGDTVSASRQYIQQIENNSKSPARDMIAALAQALNVEPEFFSMPIEGMVTEEQCHFRSLKTTPASLKLQARARGTLFDKFAQCLDEFLDLPAVNFPEFDKIDGANDIERAAEQCRNHWGLGIKSPITNMVRVLENAGALITYFSDISEKIDAFSMQRNRPLIIRNPSKESACRMRFDLAHECGHIVMHEGIETGDTKTESEANRFASAFLLPRAAFLNEFGFLASTHHIPWKKIYDLKIRWKVSNAAIIRRAYDLSLIDPIQYRNANIYLRKSGQAKIEINDDIISKEIPEIIKSSFDVIRNEEKDGILSIINKMKIRPDFLKKLLGDYDFKKEDFIRNNEKSNVINFPTEKR
jgi:Zn-dependent peptidase ImmA (M78 family)/transcriptional regulator with XRE-family HTH domain